MQAALLNPRFVLAWLVSFLGGLAFFLFIHFPRYLEDLGASEIEIGFIVGLTALAAVAIRPEIGRQMDRRGRRPVILAGGALQVVVLLLYLTITRLGFWVYTIRVAHGLAEAMLFAAVFTYAADILPDGIRTQGLALFGISGMLPIALGGLIGDFVLGRWDFQELFLLAAGLGLAALLLSIALPEVIEPAGRDGGTSFMAPLRQTDLAPLWWIAIVFSLALTAYFTFLRTYVDETGIGTVGGFFATYAVTAIVLRIVAGWVPDRVGLKNVLYPALGLFASGFVVLATAGTDAGVLVAGALCGAGHAFVFPILYSITFGRAEVKNRGSASAIFTGLFDVGTLIGGPVLGSLIATFSYRFMFFAAAGFLMVGGLVFAAWDGDLGRRRTTRVSLG